MADLDRLAEMFKLLGDKNRLQIVALLNDRELCVCEMVELLATSQPNISQHIRKLKDAQLIKETRKGQWNYYSLSAADKPYLQAVLTLLPNQEDKFKQFTPVACC
jgi:ArsR family transcriptional regulator, arsenate/arsenite/antimonite-responsive transcriptional repressor